METKTRSFASDAKAVVHSACRGIVALNPHLRYDEENRVISRKATRGQSRVTILSGGGSGHEPAHAGYVGSGMLDAAVCGAVFASPTILQIEAGLRSVSSDAGVLVIVKNYTGDKLNFTLATERFNISTGIPVRVVVVADDVSIGKTKSALVGRRGLAGTVLVHKVAGAAVSDGANLDEIVHIVEYINERIGTIGVSLEGCDLPGQSTQARLQADELEIGIGIHNEPGSRRVRPRPTMTDLISDMLSTLLDNSDADRSYIKFDAGKVDHEIVLMINNLGGISVLEQTAVTGEVVAQLEATYKIKPARTFAGTFLSALNAPGFSITILALPKNDHFSPKVLNYLDAPTDAIGWRNSIIRSAWEELSAEDSKDGSHDLPTRKAKHHIPDMPCDPSLFGSIVHSVHSALVAAEPEITRMDTIMGDGDCGTTLLGGSSSIVTALENKEIRPSSLSHGLVTLADVLSRNMGGTSGALYSVFFTTLASAVCSSECNGNAEAQVMIHAINTAYTRLKQVTAARVGDRTMMDALIPFVEVFTATSGPILQVLSSAVTAAENGCEKTRLMTSKFGRSTYVSSESDTDLTTHVPDPGACGIVAIVTGIRDAIEAYQKQTRGA